MYKKNWFHAYYSSDFEIKEINEQNKTLLKREIVTDARLAPIRKKKINVHLVEGCRSEREIDI